MPAYPNDPAAVDSRCCRRATSSVLDPLFRNPYSVQATVGVEQTLFGMVVGVDVDVPARLRPDEPGRHERAGVSARSPRHERWRRPTRPVRSRRCRTDSGRSSRSGTRAAAGTARCRSRPTGPRVRCRRSRPYTWSRIAEEQANYVLPEDSRNLDAEKGRADNDVRHNLSVGFTWQMPGGRRGLNGLTLSGVRRVSEQPALHRHLGRRPQRHLPERRAARRAQHRQRRDSITDRRSVAREAVSRRANSRFEARIEAFNMSQHGELRPVRRRAVVSVFRTTGVLRFRGGGFSWRRIVRF